MRYSIFFFQFSLIVSLVVWQPPIPFLGSNQQDDDEYYEKGHLRYDNHVYFENIKTVKLHSTKWELSLPIFQLNTQEQLVFRFDDLDNDYKNYSYTFIHCDANWQPSTIVPTEYISGFLEEQLFEVEYSFNTNVRYSHYSSVFPNENIRITKSGNYILLVFLDFDRNKVAVTRRFCVFENRVSLEARVKQSSILDDCKSKHEIDFTIHHKDYKISNPFGDIQVVLTQNNRWDNAIRGLKPVFVKQDKLVYEYNGKNTFWAGNEFRNVDLKSYKYNSPRIMSIKDDSTVTQVFLYADVPRRFERYVTHMDINGSYIVRNSDLSSPKEYEADYALVHFALAYPQPIVNGNIYVFGGLSDWKFQKRFKMTYSYENKGYLLPVLLKQGYYNYLYAYLEDGTEAGALTYIEGSHYETEQNYTIYVYHRGMVDFYDRLVGLRTLNSLRDF